MENSGITAEIPRQSHIRVPLCDGKTDFPSVKAVENLWKKGQRRAGQTAENLQKNGSLPRIFRNCLPARGTGKVSAHPLPSDMDKAGEEKIPVRRRPDSRDAGERTGVLFQRPGFPQVLPEGASGTDDGLRDGFLPGTGAEQRMRRGKSGRICRGFPKAPGGAEWKKMECRLRERMNVPPADYN